MMPASYTLNDSIDTLGELSNDIAVSGFEISFQRKILSTIKPYVDKAWLDSLGNVLAVKEGKKSSPKLLLDVHVDEVGFLIKYIDPRGFLFFEPLGGWDNRLFPGQRVILQPQNVSIPNICGVIGIAPPHLTTASSREKTIPLSQLYIDIGANSLQSAHEMGVEIGTPGTLAQKFTKLTSNRVLGKAFDDRGGCAVLLHIIKKLHEDPCDATIMCNFAVSEELGARGAGTGAYSLNPDMAVAIETTTAADVPKVSEQDCPTKLGKGPAITIADRSLVSDSRMVTQLKALASKNQIPWQLKQSVSGGTDGGRIHLVRGGIPTTVVSIPCRYIHSPISILDPQDLAYTIDLVYKFIHNPSKLTW